MLVALYSGVFLLCQFLFAPICYGAPKHDPDYIVRNTMPLKISLILKWTTHIDIYKIYCYICIMKFCWLHNNSTIWKALIVCLDISCYETFKNAQFVILCVIMCCFYYSNIYNAFDGLQYNATKSFNFGMQILCRTNSNWSRLNIINIEISNLNVATKWLNIVILFSKQRKQQLINLTNAPTTEP